MPEHCEKNEVSAMSNSRFLFPRVWKKTFQPFLEFSFSSRIVSCISWNSELTKSLLASPFAWYCKRVSEQLDGDVPKVFYLDQYRQCFCVAILGAEPSGTFWKQPNANHLDEWHGSLNTDWNPPGSICGQLDSAEYCPCCDNGAEIPQRIVHGGKLAAMLWVGKLHDQKWCRALCQIGTILDQHSTNGSPPPIPIKVASRPMMKP